GIPADLGHVGELHELSPTVQPCLQCLDPGVADGDKDRLLRRYGSADERQGAGEEIALPGIEQRLVAKGRLSNTHKSTATTSRICPTRPGTPRTANWHLHAATYAKRLFAPPPGV